MKVYNRFNLPPRTPHKTVGESLTQQHFAEEANINSIMGRYARTGILGNPSTGPARQPFEGDFSQNLSFHEMQNKIVDAQTSFDNMPSHIRNKFENDPQKLIDFLSTEKNLEEAQALGLVNKPEIEDTSPIEVTIKTPEQTQETSDAK